MTKSPIPDAVLDKHVALLGMTGAGKTSVIKTAIVEPDLEAERRVLIITPKDDWWGLRLSKSGKSPGFDIPIFGGRHADYPLQVKDAALLAEAYGTMKGSAIFCTSLLSGQDRAHWFADFAERLLVKNHGWLRVVIDEAHVFMPKQGAKGGGKVPLALHAGNELVGQGRSAGLRIVLASQRSAKLHNDSLTQCSCLMAMLLMAPHDRDAVKDWIEDQADPVRGKEIIASMASLNPGQAWVWAPGAKFLECVQFARPSTFDSSAAPEDDNDAEHRLRPINLDALKGKLATVEAERKASDPKELRAEIARLKIELKNIPAADPKAIEEAEIRGIAAGKRQALQALGKFAADLSVGVSRAASACSDAQSLLNSYASFVDTQTQALPSGPPPRSSPRGAPPERAGGLPARKPLPRMAGDNGAHPAADLSGPEQRILDAIRWWNVLGVPAPTHAQTAFIAGYSHKSGTWATYLSRLRSMNMIEGRGDLVLTDDGAAIANEPDTPPSGKALRAVVLAKLDGPLTRILSPIIDAYPNGLDHSDAGEAAGYSPQSGTWATYLSRLRSLDLIEGRGELKAQEWLFP